jgi:ComF family protein
LRSWAIFGGQVRHALHQLKYGRNIGLGEVMARPMLHLLQATGWQVEVVIPVPLGLARLKERGYNQASMLAWPIAIALNARYRPRALRRERETRSQVGLSAAERRLNMADAFGAQGQWVSDQNVLVVDDVTTSGSTLDACAAALLRAGAAKVYGLTLARAPLRSDGSDQV